MVAVVGSFSAFGAANFRGSGRDTSAPAPDWLRSASAMSGAEVQYLAGYESKDVRPDTDGERGPSVRERDWDEAVAVHRGTGAVDHVQYRGQRWVRVRIRLTAVIVVSESCGRRNR